jgi:hypothetical protein
MTRSTLLIAAAVACFIVAFLIAVGAVTGNDAAWGFGGLALFAGSFWP